MERKGPVSRNSGDLRDSCAPYRIQNPSNPQNAPHIHPESSPEIKIRNHPAAKGVRQKESGKKVTKKVTKASEKVTEK